MYPYPPLTAEVTLTASAGQVATLIDSLTNVILSITQTLDPGVPAWRLYDDLTSGGLRNRVFYSSGSNVAGTAAIYFRLFQTTTTALQCSVYSDWSNLSHAGSGGSSTPVISLNDTGEIYYYFNGNEHAIAAVISQSNHEILYAGELIRDFCHPGMAGRAFLASSASSGSNITFTVDQDISRALVTGTQGYIIAQTPSGSALKGLAWSISQITNVNGNEITMANTYFTHSAGDLFGVFPQTNIVVNMTNQAAPISFSGYTAIGSASTFTSVHLARTPHQSSYEQACDPNVYRRFEAMYWGIKDNTTSTPGQYVRSWWGLLHHLLLVGNDGNWNLNDRIRINFDNDRVYRVFPSSTWASTGFIPAWRCTSSIV